MASGLLRGFPVSSSGSRTAISDALGSRSQLHSLVALGALVIYAALRLIEWAEFHRIAAFRRSELVLAVATLVGVLLLGVLYGILAAIALSILDQLRRASPTRRTSGTARPLRHIRPGHLPTTRTQSRSRKHI